MQERPLSDAKLSQVKYNKTSQYNDLQGAGCPKRIKNRDIRRLKRLVKGDGRLTADKTASDLNASFPKPVSTRTIHRYLRELGFEYVVTIKKNNGSLANIDNNVLTGVHSIYIGHWITREKLSFPMSQHSSY